MTLMGKGPRLLHIADGESSDSLANALFRNRLAEIGELTLLFNGSRMSPDTIAAHVRRHDVYLAGWSSVALPAALAQDSGCLKYVCGITGSMRQSVPVELVQSGIPLTNWGDAPAQEVAEGALLLLLASVKSLHARVQWVRSGNFGGIPRQTGGTLSGLNVGIYGCGVIARRFIEMLQPFGAVARVFDPYLKDPPPNCQVVDSLQELFAASEAVVIHAALTPETQNTVTAELLARLPDGGVVVNTARGGIVDQSALFKELEAGRLRAGLDVLEPDWLEPQHPARKWQNLILTCHSIAQGPPPNGLRRHLMRYEEYCLENLRRFVAGQPLRFVMDPVRYRHST